MSNIRSREAVTDGLWDWEFLNGCFQRGARLSDVDGIIEYSDHVLMVEGARTDRVYEQARFGVFEGMRRRDTVVLLLFGVPGATPVITHAQMYGRHAEPLPCSTAEVVAAVKLWAEYADRCKYEGHPLNRCDFHKHPRIIPHHYTPVDRLSLLHDQQIQDEDQRLVNWNQYCPPWLPAR